jgi:hypothetical protein
MRFNGILAKLHESYELASAFQSAQLMFHYVALSITGNPLRFRNTSCHKKSRLHPLARPIRFLDSEDRNPPDAHASG